MLYIVSTPIGNLKDISLRALKILKDVDLILCEDTRVTKKLLNRYDISTNVESYHQHSRINKIEKIKELLKEKDLALVSDSGTPGICDPGNQLIKQLDCEISVIPGACAVTAIASVSGLSMDKFVFMGFPPHKKGRNKFFKEILSFKYPVIIYESPYRIEKTLKELGDREVVIGRELTKKFETIYRGIASEIKIKTKGEFVIVIK